MMGNRLTNGREEEPLVSEADRSTNKPMDGEPDERLINAQQQLQSLARRIRDSCNHASTNMIHVTNDLEKHPNSRRVINSNLELVKASLEPLIKLLPFSSDVTEEVAIAIGGGGRNRSQTPVEDVREATSTVEGSNSSVLKRAEPDDLGTHESGTTTERARSPAVEPGPSTSKSHQSRPATKVKVERREPSQRRAAVACSEKLHDRTLYYVTSSSDDESSAADKKAKRDRHKVKRECQPPDVIEVDSGPVPSAAPRRTLSGPTASKTADSVHSTPLPAKRGKSEGPNGHLPLCLLASKENSPNRRRSPTPVLLSDDEIRIPRLSQRNTPLPSSSQTPVVAIKQESIPDPQKVVCSDVSVQLEQLTYAQMRTVSQSQKIDIYLDRPLNWKPRDEEGYLSDSDDSDADGHVIGPRKVKRRKRKRSTPSVVMPSKRLRVNFSDSDSDRELDREIQAAQRLLDEDGAGAVRSDSDETDGPVLPKKRVAPKTPTPGLVGEDDVRLDLYLSDDDDSLEQRLEDEANEVRRRLAPVDCVEDEKEQEMVSDSQQQNDEDALVGTVGDDADNLVTVPPATSTVEPETKEDSDSSGTNSSEESEAGIESAASDTDNRLDALLRTNIRLSESDDEENGEEKKQRDPAKRKRKSKGRRRKRRRVERDSSESSTDGGSATEEGGLDPTLTFEPQPLNDDANVPVLERQSSSVGRKSRQIWGQSQLSASTRTAEREERNRIKRLQTLTNKREEIQSTKKVILDKGIGVHESLSAVLKAHQIEGIQFLYDSAVESLERFKSKKPGGGCILAHCMGLGKTLQVIAFLHTLLTTPPLCDKFKKVLILVPVNVLLNWIDEFNRWLRLDSDGLPPPVKVHSFVGVDKQTAARVAALRNWHENGGVFLMGYEMYRKMMGEDKRTSEAEKMAEDELTEYLRDPGPDMVFCDEGHRLKGDIKKNGLVRALLQIDTKLRFCLTGTPLQNNLMEYYNMMQFVKPGLLGNEKEFKNGFRNPIRNGQYKNSDPRAVSLMKHRSHVLNKKLEGVVQRKDYQILTEQIPRKYEYVLALAASPKQHELYNTYFSKVVGQITRESLKKRGRLFDDFNNFLRIGSHPMLVSRKKKPKPIRSASNENEEPNSSQEQPPPQPWWFETLGPIEQMAVRRVEFSGKFMLLFDLIEECQKQGDKLLVFSQSLDTLWLIETFLEKHKRWHKGREYFRLDGSVKNDDRHSMQKKFNREERSRLFLISTRAGSLGINLVGANRVVIFDACWNPSHDMQAMFRAYRYGQQKPVYIYRFITAGTMEEKIYNRQVTKESLALRVVDEHQIERHYLDTDLAELYTFQLLHPNPQMERPQLPEDKVLANLLCEGSSRQWICRYHQHDSLLQHREEETLSKEEQDAAWEAYERDRGLGAGPDPGQFGVALGNLALQQLANMNLMAMADLQGPLQNQWMDDFEDGRAAVLGLNERPAAAAPPPPQIMATTAPIQPVETAPAQLVRQAVHSTPKVGQVIRRAPTTPSVRQVIRTPTTSVGQVTRTPTTSMRQFTRTPTPKVRQVIRTPNPSVRQVIRTPTTSVGQVSNTSTPSVREAATPSVRQASHSQYVHQPTHTQWMGQGTSSQPTTTQPQPAHTQWMRQAPRIPPPQASPFPYKGFPLPNPKQWNIER